MDKATKKHVKRYLSWGALALVVVILTVMPLLAKSEAEADGPVASILSATAEKGSITTTLRGGGTLAAAQTENVTLPSGVKIEKFLVNNGDMVTQGTPLALVDKVSVMTAITGVNETLEYLREELEAHRDEKVASAITATAGGRVKKVFAREGESVQEVMLRDGALAVLSIDGRMAVKIEKQTALLTGDSVTVTLADGEEVRGHVESNLDGELIITVEDEGYEIGQTVTAATEDGQSLGQGALYIHNAWKATAYSGTIQTVNAKEEKELSSGATLFTLTDRDYEGELQRRASQHREYEELLQELLQMHNTGLLTAPCDGEVSGVDEDSAYLLSAVPEGWVIAPLNSTVTGSGEKSWTVMLLSGGTSQCANSTSCTLTWEEHTEATRSCPSLCQLCHGKVNAHTEECITHCRRVYPCDAKNHYDDCSYYCTQASDPAKCTVPNHHPNCIHSCTHGTAAEDCQGRKNHYLTCIESCQSKTVENLCPATGEHRLDCVESCVKADVLGVCKSTVHSKDCIQGCNGKLTCLSNKHTTACPHYQLTYTARVGIVVRVVQGQIVYTYESAESVPATKVGSSYTIAAVPNPKTMVYGPDFVPSNGVACSPGDIILIITGVNRNNDVIVDKQVYLYSKGSTGGMDISGMLGSMGGRDSLSMMIGGFSGFGSYASGAAAETEELFDLEGDTLLTVTPRTDATLTIALDEHDIARVALGMEATVTVEALKDREYPATVTGISRLGVSGGGSSKFDVELTLDMDADMIPGMSAAARIPLETKEEVLMIPVEALVQEGTRTVVYTALDEKTGQPASPVEVVTGVSDGVSVEILSGLEEGQTFYYSYYDTYEVDTSAEAEKYTF